jgi:hypothetical protein
LGGILEAECLSGCISVIDIKHRHRIPESGHIEPSLAFTVNSGRRPDRQKYALTSGRYSLHTEIFEGRVSPLPDSETFDIVPPAPLPPDASVNSCNQLKWAQDMVELMRPQVTHSVTLSIDNPTKTCQFKAHFGLMRGDNRAFYLLSSVVILSPAFWHEFDDDDNNNKV